MGIAGGMHLGLHESPGDARARRTRPVSRWRRLKHANEVIDLRDGPPDVPSDERVTSRNRLPVSEESYRYAADDHTLHKPTVDA